MGNKANSRGWTEHRYYFSHDHEKAARALAGLARQVEDVNDRSRLDEHRAFVTGSILSSVAFLEATINELFADSDEMIGKTPITESLGLSTVSAKRLGAIWRLELFNRRAGILEKYDTALRITDKNELDHGQSPYQDVKSLIELRNSLVHAKPDWIKIHDGLESEFQELQHRLERKLRNKFSLNPFAKDRESFYPNKCLSYGCAQWAVNSSAKFVSTFNELIGLLYRYELAITKTILNEI